MSARELVVLGTASQVPTRNRNHNGYLLRWDGEGVLFDPGEGTQRQMLRAGVSAHDITRICVTHFHGDHCLGLAGVIQRINLDAVPWPVDVYYPASGQRYFEHLRHASAFRERAELRPQPIDDSGELKAEGAPFTLDAVRLSHPVDSFGYRITEADRRSMLPERLRDLGIAGPAVGRLQREGRLELPGGRTVTVEEVSEVRRGKRFAFVMDTRLCEGVEALAEGADVLVVEATFLHRDAALAQEHGHLTARQAAETAAAAGVGTLVLTHFSQRYPDLTEHRVEAEAFHQGELHLAEDLMRIPLR
ncbi:ribonuclease Z [Streptacidiphilus monticola]|uniref:Ribonuclease Z n=1 Tax=Streptacidiphilus monticola TaxID=2161674 RepID=A0ABW1GB02_9ACTN